VRDKGQSYLYCKQTIDMHSQDGGDGSVHYFSICSRTMNKVGYCQSNDKGSQQWKVTLIVL